MDIGILTSVRVQGTAPEALYNLQSSLCNLQSLSLDTAHQPYSAACCVIDSHCDSVARSREQTQVVSLEPLMGHRGAAFGLMSHVV